MRAHGLIVLALLGASFAGCIEGLTDSSLDSSDLQGDMVNATALPTVAHLPGGEIVDDAVTSTPVSAEWLGIGRDAVEPTLGITSEGVMFYAAATFDSGEATSPVTDVLRSRDGGLTWEDVTPRLPTGGHSPPQTGDPYVYVDGRTDRVFTFDMFPALTCGYLSYSDDDGDSWTTQPAACAQGVPYDHQTIASGPSATGLETPLYDGYVLQCVNRVSDALCARSPDGGLTWSPTTPVFLGYEPTRANVSPTAEPFDNVIGALDGLCGGLHGHLAIGPDGTAYLPKSHCGDPMVGISTDDGLTWTQVNVAPDLVASSGPDPAVAVDAAGNVYYAFVSEAGDLYLVVSEDGGATWGEPLQVAAPGVTAAHLPALAAGDEGKVAFAYLGTENLPGGYATPEGVEDAERQKQINNATWNGYIGIIENALDAEPVIQTAYVNDPSDPLVRGYCGPGRCPGNYDFIDVVISPVDGMPYAAMVDACIDKCATPEGTHEDSNAFAGAVAKLTAGPKLLTEGNVPAFG